MDKSWIKLHRKFLESPLWKYSVSANLPHLISLWVFILLSVNWEEKKWYDGKQENDIPPGSLITSLQHLADNTGITCQKVRTSLEHYENMGMITRKTTNKWTQVWIVNWDKYQMKDNSNNMQDNIPITNEQQTDNKPITTTKEYKNIRINTISLSENQKNQLKKQFPYLDIEYEVNRFREWQRGTGKEFPNVLARFKAWLLQQAHESKKETNVILVDPIFKQLLSVWKFDEGVGFIRKVDLQSRIGNKYPTYKYQREWEEAKKMLNEHI